MKIAIYILEGNLMFTLNIDYFLPPIEDIEYNQYKILAILKAFRKQFRKNKLYPAFTELNQIDRFLNTYLSKSSLTKSTDSKKIMTLFPDNTEGNNENNNNESQDDPETVEIIRWAKPHVEATMTEGYAIYEFVQSNLRIKSIEPMPSYRDQGYFIVRDYNNAQLLLIEYSCYFFESKKAPVRSLKTKLITQVPCNKNYSSPTEVGIRLIEKYGDLVNPAIYICDSNLELPFSETIFPIAKGKLLSSLTRHQVKYY
ncbi:MAG: hypothetical protein P8Y81_02820 [Ignavibacteriaceae bacterium]